MGDFILFDPIFRVPFATGLCLAFGLSLVGAFLRMRDEWLAALGLSHLAAAGGMGAAFMGWPILVGAFGMAGIAMLLRAVLPRVGNSLHALMILLGWSATLLIGSYTHHGQSVGETLLRGQLYFSHTGHLSGAIALCVTLLASYTWMSPRLLTARFFPDYHRSNRVSIWPYQALLAVMVMMAAVLGTIAIGAFPAFALLFVPSWIGFVLVHGWFRSVVVTVLIGCMAYIVSFVAAMLLDLPFGPVLTAVLVISSALRFLSKRHIAPVSAS